jgi:hypothetical protein
LQANFWHETGLPATQLPWPLHLEVTVPGAPQVWLQTWFESHRRQAPAPSQLPSRPQVATAEAAQRASGSAVPALTDAHVPLPAPVLADEQDEHVPAQAELQQNPEAQNPVAHSLAALHVAPWAFFARHVVPEQ